jgi:hypothetical protein
MVLAASVHSLSLHYLCYRQSPMTTCAKQLFPDISRSQWAKPPQFPLELESLLSSGIVTAPLCLDVAELDMVFFSAGAS